MKKINEVTPYLVVLALSILLLSCDKDDDKKAASIVGEWEEYLS